MGAKRTRAWRRLVATVSAVIAVAVAVACGGGGATDAAPHDEDAGADGVAPDALGDAAVADASREGDTDGATLLVQGDVELLGITLDGYVAYRLRDVSQTKDKLAVVPLSGGPPIVLSDDLGGGTWYTRVGGFSVAFWTGAGEDSLGTFNVWTKATGIESAPGHRSLLNFFAASFGSDTFIFATGVSDGGLVDGSVDNVGYAATSSAKFDTTDVIQDVNVAATKNNCPITVLADYSDTLFLAHCTGTSPNAVFGRVVVAKHQSDGTVTTSVLLSEKLAAEAIIPFYGIRSDRTGTKLFVVGAQPAGEGRVIDVATRKVTPLDPNATDGVISSDGGAVFYVSNGIFKSAATDGTQKVVLLDGGYDHTLAVSDDQRRFVFASGPGGTTDLQLVDSVTPDQTPTTLLKDAGAFQAIFLGSGEEVVYLSIDPSTGRGECHLVLVDGGAERKIASDVRFCDVAPKSDVVLFGDNLRQLGPFVVMDLWMIDRAKGATTPVLIGADVPNSKAFAIWEGQIVYPKKGVEGGLYARKLP
ncbi:MAG: hypothetical protein JWO86_2348 [Myxococcaceae bacterium]|jgi:hypothetical protein|nr:hypothetical protein [Myxococcaceae bacterium]MEA2750980.1 hypothetical protein [Myxococcales bacterium]